MTEMTIGEACLEAKAAYPDSIIIDGWRLTWIGSWDVSEIVRKLELNQ